ncbi:MAG TPA: peptidoglycan-associated lipoprotein Pal [Gammaproteobacteria bacterium]|nr:peptidoglycan-associated lipoprotein Pal [Gammaproteobacteria bacterium]
MRYLIILSVVVTLSACGLGPLKKRGGSNDTTADNQGDNTYSTPADDSADKFKSAGSLDVTSLNDPNSPLSQRVLYFDLDSSQIKDEDREIITFHAEFLAAHPDITIVLEGHADERGSREYNIALGEKRAKAVKQLMTLQGVAEAQIQVISFGEERPVAIGHDSSAWNLNRRVEILYTGY